MNHVCAIRVHRPSAQSSDTFYVPIIESHSSYQKPKRDRCWESTKVNREIHKSDWPVIKYLRKFYYNSVQYQLSEETISHLKTPTFDIWQWDHNEVSLILSS